MIRREFLKLGFAALILLLVKPWKLIVKLAPKPFLYAQTGKAIYPGKEKIFNREGMLQPSAYAG